MAKATLLISSKNYSSWSLRGWLMTRMSGLPFEFVARLVAAGVDAVPSYRYIPEDGRAAEARLQEAVRLANADAAIVTRLVRVEKRTNVSRAIFNRLRPSVSAYMTAPPPPGSVTMSRRASTSTTCTSRRRACTR